MFKIMRQPRSIPRPCTWAALALCLCAARSLRPSEEITEPPHLGLLQTSLVLVKRAGTKKSSPPEGKSKAEGVTPPLQRKSRRLSTAFASRIAKVLPQNNIPLQDAGDKILMSPAVRELLVFGFGIFAMLGAADWYRFYCLRVEEAARSGGTEAAAASLLGSAGSIDERIADAKAAERSKPREKMEWSTLGLVALTSYRFYTGFLSASWLPYLLAMEGADLWKENQSLFMGVAKLIYGLTILTNPLFGLLGDRAVRLSHGVGRRLFLRCGVAISALGILGCVMADRYHNFYLFVAGILLWRIGEALNDVTAEALVPELVPQSQYAVASAAKATSFLLGGVFAYILLMVMTDYHYTWLYWAYTGGMLIFALPCQLLLSDDGPLQSTAALAREPFLQTLQKAYVAPAFIDGYFPQLCLGVFVFSFGTSPMFFLLLMIRDLVGIDNQVQLQESFSTSSIIFFIAAAAATVVGGLSDKRQMPEEQEQSETSTAGIKDPLVLIRRVNCVMYVGVAYAVVALALPVVCLFEQHQTRMWIFYVFALLLGSAFGSGFARFQDITWQLIPPGVDVANAMGFNIMCRLFGVGVGNFIAGVVLEFYMIPEQVDWYLQPHSKSLPLYRPMGYIVMCTFCAAVSVFSSWIMSRIANGVKLSLDQSMQAPRHAG